jgi:chromosomal replication initiator protein
VCDVFGVDEQSLQSPGKAASIAVPRMLVMFLARKWTRAALSEISHKLGRKSHSTVLSAQQKIEALLTSNETVPLLHSQCRVEEAIKRVEAKLRVG